MITTIIHSFAVGFSQTSEGFGQAMWMNPECIGFSVSMDMMEGLGMNAASLFMVCFQPISTVLRLEYITVALSYMEAD